MATPGATPPRYCVQTGDVSRMCGQILLGAGRKAHESADARRVRRLRLTTPTTRPFDRRMRASFLTAGVLSVVVAACSSEQPAHTTSTASSSSSGGHGGTGGAPPAIPEPVVNELRSHTTPVADTAYQAKSVTQFRTTAALPDLDVRALAVIDTSVYAGTASGVARRKDGETAFTALALTASGPVVDLAVTNDGRLVVARADGVEVLTAQGGAGTVFAITGETITSVAMRGNEVWVGTDKGLTRLDAAGQTPAGKAHGFAVRDLVVAADAAWMATAAGLRCYDFTSGVLLPDLTAPAALADNDVRALALSTDGFSLLAATATGLARLPTNSSTATIVTPGETGLPNGDLRAVAEAGGEVITGHGIGASVLLPSGKEHYHSLRYIPDEAVTAVAIGPDRSRWIATKAGISRVSFSPAKLADKAATLAPLVAPHWRMDGFVADEIGYADPWDQTTAPGLGDFDNDGLWTEMQIAAWCLAYAATGDEAHYQNARKAMDTMFLLIDIPGETFAAKGMARGYIARSLVREDEGSVYTSKAGDERWVAQTYQGKSYYWKNDTSSDEYAGHFFGMPLFHDLCAKTDEERKGVRDRMALAMSYVIAGGDTLIDLDGKPTTFGRWDHLADAVDGDLGACLGAGKPNCVSSYGGGGWLNSIEILGHLLATWHVTGDAKFYEEYDRLAVKERYGDMIPLTDHTYTVTSPHMANHSDHELATLSYHTLLRYEPNADRRARWVESMRAFYGYEKPERNALEIAVMSSAVDDSDHPLAAETLRQMPIDRREWQVDNTHRVDAAMNGTDRFDDPQFGLVFPYDEIRTMKWNGNPYAVVGGGSGSAVQAPWVWLLPYWMMRYSGAIGAP